MPKLTKTLVQEAVPVDGKPTFFWDTALKGFGLLVSPKGVKSYVVQYRPENSRQARRMKVGPVSEAFGLADARDKAKSILGRVHAGGDPAAEKGAAKAEETVSDLMTRFVKEHVGKHNKPSTARCEIGLIERYITGRKSEDPKRKIPEQPLGKLRLSELTTAKVKSWHKGILSNVSGNRSLAHLSRACVMAIEYGWMIGNPCSKITKNPEKRNDRAFSDDELGRIGQALRDLEGEGKMLPTVALGIRLLALTGLRPGEVRLAKWEDYSPQLKRLRLPDSKTGPRGVRLSPQAVALLDGATRVGPYIMAGSNPEKPLIDSRLSQLVQAVLQKAKVDNAHPHVFRHTAATFAAEHGDTALEIMAMGGWSTLAMVTRYVNIAGVGGDNRYPLPASARIALAMDGQTSNVVSLASAA